MRIVIPFVCSFDCHHRPEYWKQFLASLISASILSSITSKYVFIHIYILDIHYIYVYVYIKALLISILSIFRKQQHFFWLIIWPPTYKLLPTPLKSVCKLAKMIRLMITSKVTLVIKFLPHCYNQSKLSSITIVNLRYGANESKYLYLCEYTYMNTTLLVEIISNTRPNQLS